MRVALKSGVMKMKSERIPRGLLRGASMACVVEMQIAKITHEC